MQSPHCCTRPPAAEHHRNPFLLLVVAIPDQSTLTADSRARWTLLDTSGALMRAGVDALASLPRAERVIATIPAGRIVFIETPLPPVGAAKREALLRYAIEDKLTIDPSTIHAAVLGAATAGSATNAQAARHIVAAIDRQWFADALAWLGAARLQPEAVFAETDAIAVARGEWALVVAGSSGYARRDDGYAYALDTAEREAPPFALRLALGEVANPPRRITIYTLAHGEASTAPIDNALPARWQSALDIPVQNGGELTPASIGKRLMQLKHGNLLTQEFTPRRGATVMAGRLKPALIALALLTSVQIIFNVADWWRLERQRRALDAEMRATFLAAFPQAAAIVDPSLQMQRNLTELKRARGLVRDDDVRLLLAQLAEITRAVPQLAIADVAVRANTATLRGSVDSAASADLLRSQVKRVGGSDIVVSAAAPDGSAGSAANAAPAVEFTVKAGS